MQLPATAGARTLAGKADGTDVLLGNVEFQHRHAAQLNTYANAYAERWVRSVREECLAKLILLGEGSLRRALRHGVQHNSAVIFLPAFGQPVATRRRTRLEGILAVLGEIRGGGPVWDVEPGGTVCVLVADRQRPQSRARLKP